MNNNKTVRTLGMVVQDLEVEAGRSLYVKVQTGLDSKTLPHNNNLIYTEISKGIDLAL